MPVLDTERASSRSALRYRPRADMDQARFRPGPIVARRSRLSPDANFTAATTTPDDLDLEEEERSPRRGAVPPAPRQRATIPVRGPRRFHWLIPVGLLMLVMIFGWVALSALGSWWQTTQDDWHYGRPRTFQIDQVVGHHDSLQNPSHFVAMNLKRHVIIIEIPGGDVSHSVVYSGPILLGPGQDLTPVTLSFKDMNHDGKPDMVVTIVGSQLVFLNANGTFVAPTQNSAG